MGADGDNLQLIVKFILRNIIEKKFRTLVLVLSISISAALFFASQGIADTMFDMGIKKLQQNTGSSDIVLRPNDNSPSDFFTMTGVNKYKDKFEYSIGAIEAACQYETQEGEYKSINLLGIDFNQLKTMSNIVLESAEDVYPFSGEKVIISKNTAEKYGFSIGNTIEININGEKIALSICGIAQPSGVFQEYGGGIVAVVPQRVPEAVFKVKGMGNIAFIKAKDPRDIDTIIGILSKEYKSYTVREAVSSEEVDQQVGGIATTFLLVTIVVAVMSIFIIYSSFKVITTERIKVMGTFRSVGATKKMSDLVLILESIIYGIIGGVLGCFLGGIILYFMTWIMVPDWMGGENPIIAFSFLYLVEAFVLALVLSIVSSIIPILKASNIPLKEIILGMAEKESEKSKSSMVKLSIGSVFILSAIIVPPLLKNDMALPLGIVCVLLLMSGIVMLVPYMTKVFIILVQGFFSLVFGNEGVLAVKNLRNEKNITTNISLLGIAIASLLMINTVTYGALVEMNDYYTKTPLFQLYAWISNGNMDGDFEQLVRTIPGVKDARGFYNTEGIEVKGKNSSINVLEGVDRSQYLNYWNMQIDGNRQAIINELDNERNIIMGVMLRNRLNVKAGDFITLMMKNGERKYKVIGFMNTAHESGSYALISDKYFKMDQGTEAFSGVRIKTDADYKKVSNEFIKRFSKSKPETKSISEIANSDIEKNQQQFNVVKCFILISLIIGIMSVTNNLIISFIQRRRSIAMFRSIGMSKRQLRKVVFVEALSSGALGGIMGVSGGVIMISIVPYILAALGQRFVIHYSSLMLLGSFIAGILITVLASISPAAKSTKLNIVETIKIE